MLVADANALSRLGKHRLRRFNQPLWFYDDRKHSSWSIVTEPDGCSLVGSYLVAWSVTPEFKRMPNAETMFGMKPNLLFEVEPRWS